MNIKQTSLKGLVLTSLVGTLVACGGGSGSDDPTGQTSESVVARGVITQMGSIWVNGVEYETPDGGSYTNDDNTSSIANYEVGQVVSIRGSRNDDGVSGTADEVEYEAEVEGEAGADNTINGITIITDQTLASGTRYEVSGFWIDDSTIQATFIKLDDDGDGEDEVKGFVEAFVAGVSLTVHGVTYDYTGSTVVAVGDYVEIHFTGTTANEVELEDDFFDNLPEGQEVEFEGAVNLNTTDLASCPADADFMIDIYCIDWDLVVEWSDGLTGPVDMVSGIRVEAEGHFNAAGDLLIAEKIKGRGNRVRVTSIVGNLNSTDGTFDLLEGNIQVSTQDGLTEFDLNNDGTTFADIVLDEGLEVRGIRTGPTSFLALRVKSEGVDADQHELRAVVDDLGANSDTDTITVMEVSALLGAGTQLEDDDIIISDGSATTTAQINTFLDSIDDDGIVDLNNGPNDVVEVRIDTTSTPYTAKQVEIEREDD